MGEQVDRNMGPIPPENSRVAHPGISSASTQKVLKGHRGPKSKSGCTSCKVRRIKCDESKPSCQNCLLKVLECVYLPPKIPAGRAARSKSISKTSSEVVTTRGYSESESPTDLPGVRKKSDGTISVHTDYGSSRHDGTSPTSNANLPGSAAKSATVSDALRNDYHLVKQPVASAISANTNPGTRNVQNATEEQYLTQVFFQTSTHLFSIYTGSCNPFMRLRKYLPESKALRLAVQAMAALTLSDYNSNDQSKHMDRGLELQRLAYRELSLVLTHPVTSLSDATFAAVVHIGMTEPWHQLRSNQSGTVHLRTSKVLICQRHQAGVPLPPKYLCHLLLYWDLLVSLHSDSSHDGYTTDLLFSGEHSEHDPIDYIDPTLGLGVHLTQIIVDMENFLRYYAKEADASMNAHCLEIGMKFQARLLQWQPNLDTTKLLGCNGVFETSALQHILLTSEAYRQTALLLLYRSLPHLLVYTTDGHDVSPVTLLQEMASKVVSTLAAIPASSPVTTTHEWILFVTAPDVAHAHERVFVRTRMNGLLEKIGILGIKEVLDYIEEVWDLVDSGRGVSSMWMDGMHERGWYPLLG